MIEKHDIPKNIGMYLQEIMKKQNEVIDVVNFINESLSGRASYEHATKNFPFDKPRELDIPTINPAEGADHRNPK